MYQTTQRNCAHLLVVDLTAGDIKCLHRRISQVNDCIDSIKSTAQRYLQQVHRVSVMIIRDGNIRCHYHDVAIHDALPISLPNDSIRPENGKILDAIGTSIAIWRALGRRRTVCDTHQVTIFWDGQDHGSQKYDRCSIKKLIGILVGIGWQFTLVGGNNNLRVMAQQLGITNYYRSGSSDTCKGRRFVISQLRRQWLLQQVSTSKSRQPQAAA